MPRRAQTAISLQVSTFRLAPRERGLCLPGKLPIFAHKREGRGNPAEEPGARGRTSQGSRSAVGAAGNGSPIAETLVSSAARRPACGAPTSAVGARAWARLRQRRGRAPTGPRPPQRPRPSSTSLQSSSCKAVSQRTVGRGRSRERRLPNPAGYPTQTAEGTGAERDRSGRAYQSDVLLVVCGEKAFSPSSDDRGPHGRGCTDGATLIR